MIRICLLAFLSFATLLHANVGDHLRKVTGKDPKLHRMKNIDFIYLINLDKRPDKYQKTMEQLSKYEITPCRFSAVNGWEIPLKTLTEIGVKFSPEMDGIMRCSSYLKEDKVRSDFNIMNVVGQTYFVHCMSLGAIGCALSHLSILQDAYNSGYETIWVMEDDIEVIRDPRLLSDLVVQLDDTVGKGNWDILFTDRDFKNPDGEYVPCSGYPKRPNFIPDHRDRFSKKININKEFRQIGSRFGTTSMIFSRHGIERIIDFVKTYQIFLPIDFDIFQPNDIKIFSVREDVVSNLPNASSNNRNPPK